MTDFAHHNHYGSQIANKNRALAAIFGGFAIWLGAFLSGFVINEPAPYELFMALLIAVWVLMGLKIPASIAPLIIFVMLFNVGGIVSMMVMPDWHEGLIYVAVSFFLGFTAIFFASVVANKPDRLRLIFSGYLFAAVITSILGILGYFNAFPGAEIFTRFGRAKGAFQDPNVFAPFLVLPAIYCLHELLTKPFMRVLPQIFALVIISAAIFLSFSRGGWGLLALSGFMLVIALLITNRSSAFRLRIFILSISALIVFALILLVALQFDSVRDVFLNRARLIQDYDGARLGRFARHIIGYQLAMEKPFGIGTLQFGLIYGEDTHNIWLKALLEYSWLGFAAYVTLVVWTLGAGFKILFRNRPWQPMLLCAYIVFFGHLLLGNIIDTDHWRHFYLLLGIVWGCVALEHKHQRNLLIHTV